VIRIDLTSSEPLGEQVRAEIRDAIARGEVQPGQALPTVRQLSADLGINLNTVARAYRLLEAEGLVTSIRGRGTFVRAAQETPRRAKRQLMDRIGRAARQVIADARLAGLGRDDLEELFAREADAIWPKE
jgi:GntR family transcriptional regulator